MGVFKLPDGYYAMLNVCPHKGPCARDRFVAQRVKPTIGSSSMNEPVKSFAARGTDGSLTFALGSSWSTRKSGRGHLRCQSKAIMFLSMCEGAVAMATCPPSNALLVRYARVHEQVHPRRVRKAAHCPRSGTPHVDDPDWDGRLQRFSKCDNVPNNRNIGI